MQATLKTLYCYDAIVSNDYKTDTFRAGYNSLPYAS